MSGPLLDPPERYVRPGEGAPNLHPMPTGRPGVESPREVWRGWWALEKAPLTVTAELDGDWADTRAFDGMLSAAAMRAADGIWAAHGRQAWVVPLPLDLLGVVALGGGRNPSRLPVWACGPLRGEGRRATAHLIGHAGELRGLLSYLHELDGGRVFVRRWTVGSWAVSPEEARATIAAQRPMPGRDDRWSPPYFWDWTAHPGGYGPDRADVSRENPADR